MDKAHNCSKEAADLLEGAVWLSTWIPRKGLSGWMWRQIIPSACRENFEYVASAFAGRPRHQQNELLAQLRLTLKEPK